MSLYCEEPRERTSANQLKVPVGGAQEAQKSISVLLLRLPVMSPGKKSRPFVHSLNKAGDISYDLAPFPPVSVSAPLRPLEPRGLEWQRKTTLEVGSYLAMSPFCWPVCHLACAAAKARHEVITFAGSS